MQPQMNGILLIDKPAGISSAKAVGRVKYIFGAKKLGHSGTLDPFATGLLVCCMNQATRLSRFFIESRKTYEAVMHLGVETDTQDKTGSIVAENEVPSLASEEIEAVFRAFTGEIEQIPPAFSALKHHGVPLYKLARKGRPVEKPPRRIFVESLEINSISLPEIRFTVRCSAGGYVRTLASDIGSKLGCGAHLKTLRRTGSGHFSVKNAVPLDALTPEDASGPAFISMNSALPDMPFHIADGALADKIKYGSIIQLDEVPLPDGTGDEKTVKIIDDVERLLAVVRHKKENFQYDYCCVFHSNMNKKE